MVSVAPLAVTLPLLRVILSVAFTWNVRLKSLVSFVHVLLEPLYLALLAIDQPASLGKFVSVSESVVSGR